MNKNNLFLLLALPFTTHGMETAKPIIRAELHINPQEHRAYYVSSSYITFLNKIGIKSSIKEQQKMPHIGVIAFYANPGDIKRDWNCQVPRTIQEYEFKKITALQKIKEEEISQAQSIEILKKTFPHHIPADILYGKDTGDAIHLTVHGYAVILTCAQHFNSHQSFKDNFMHCIEKFSQQPSYYADSLHLMTHTIEEELKKLGINCNSFIGIGELLLEDKPMLKKIILAKKEDDICLIQ